MMSAGSEVTAGTVNVEGKLRVRVERAGANTAMADIPAPSGDGSSANRAHAAHCGLGSWPILVGEYGGVRSHARFLGICRAPPLSAGAEQLRPLICFVQC